MNRVNADILKKFPPPDEQAADRMIDAALEKFNRKIVVLDDDPTGIQTVHGVSVYTSWDENTFRDAFWEPNNMFFILTNSRALPKSETSALHREIGRTISKISEESGKEYVLLSRSDSTLRGHFPPETSALRESIEAVSGKRFHGEILAPFFKEGGRFTIGNTHYVSENGMLTPAGQTEFARDESFGYKSSDLGEYVEEKTNGAYKKSDCIYIPLEELRSGNIGTVTNRLMQADGFRKVIVNAAEYADMKVFIAAYAEAVLREKEFLFRCAAAVPKVLGAIADAPLLSRKQLIDDDNKNGGIVLIGSHVQKTTRQLEAARALLYDSLECIEFDQHLITVENGLNEEVNRVVSLTEKNIRSGKNVIVYTKREKFELHNGGANEQLIVSSKISGAVTGIIGRLKTRPRFIIAKGGVTSSDVGTKALRVKKATVLGQVKPGIPVWLTGAESKFPGLPYIIFPGNVGSDDTLKEIIEELL
ncbi:MAG: hydroxyacid dehydrogenase [Oscillospiraceae bacterium]|nr:hydroxyacid dehydrogenase [Oscillospiraceae bacterium]